MRKHGLPLALALVALGCDGTKHEEPARQVIQAATLEATTVLSASADTTVLVGAQNRNLGNSPTLDVNRALVQFDRTSLRAAVGAQDRLISARLRLTLTENSLRRLPRVVGAFRLLKAWTELGATWNCAVDGNTSNQRPDCSGAAAWSMGILPPHPFALLPTSTVTIPAQRTGVVEFDVTADVERFLNGTAEHHGWMLLGSTPGQFAEFAARESGTPPQLALAVKRCNASLCDDGNACTTDACDANALCTHTTLPSGSSCGPGFICDSAGSCQGIPQVVINEVESNQGSPGDWVELFNAGTGAANVSGWVFKDNDNGHAFTLAAGTTIAPGGYLVLDEGTFGFGLGAADSARLFDGAGATVDSYTWTAHATTTYGRCPNGSGAFTTTASATKGAANDCPVATPDAGAPVDAGSPDAGTPWPGGQTVTTVDPPATFTGNLSGLTYEPGTPASAPVLWAVQNGPSLLYKLRFDETSWVPDSADGWGAGKTLVYPGGAGGPDSEGITRAELASPAIYVATERDNAVNGVSRLSVLRFDTSAAGATLIATHEWNLTADLPAVGANLGLETITWVPDDFLVAHGFREDATNQPYNPSTHANHGTGLFFVGIEANGVVYAYALDHVTGAFQRVATISTGLAGVMGSEFDRESGYLWSYCDNTCGNRAVVLTIDTTGHFSPRATYNRPAGMPDINNEGIAIAPEGECVAGFKSFFWSDDSDTGGNSLRVGTLPCGTFIP